MSRGERSAPAPVSLTAHEARRAALWSQGLLGAAPGSRPGGLAHGSLPVRADAVRQVLEHLGAVQLDTISVLARSHELVPYARLGPVGRDAVETAYWGAADSDAAARTFEYWSHAACLLPVSEWPWFAFRRRHYVRRGVRWHDVPTAAVEAVRQRLRSDGPVTAGDLGGARRGGDWWDWSETKIAVEWLLDIGEVAVVRRVGWRRVYALAADVLPAPVLRTGPGGPSRTG